MNYLNFESQLKIDMKIVSLITPIINEEALLKRGLGEIESFIHKLPLSWELVLVIDPSKDKTAELAAKLKSKNITVVIIENKKHLGRAKSLQLGLTKATGDYLLAFPLDLASPLAELFQFLQEAVTNEKAELILGNRNTSRKKREAKPRSTWFWTLEKIILEKWRRFDSEIHDPLCNYFLLTRPAYDKVAQRLSLSKWHYVLEVINTANQQQLNIVQIPILSKDFRPSKIKLWKEYLNNLF